MFILLKKKTFAFIWFLLSLLFPIIIQGDSWAVHNIYVIFCAISYFFCFYNWIVRNGKVFSIYVFFVSYCLFSNLGQSLLALFPNIDVLLNVYTSESMTNIIKMLSFQNKCIAALNLGGLLYMSSSRIITTKDILEKFAYKKTNSIRDNFLDILLFSSMIYFLIVCIRMLVMRQTMDYATFFESGRGQDQNRWTLYLDFLVIFLSIRNIYQGRRIKVIYFFYIAYIILYMLVGSRGLSIRFTAMLLSTIPIVYPNLLKKRFIPLWFFGFIAGFAFLSVIGNNRSSAGSNFDNQNTLIMNVYNAISEMGRSEQPPILTIEAVDGGHLQYQTISATILKALIPFSSGLDFCNRNAVSLGDWVSSYAGVVGYGLGYSCIAEAYMNYAGLGWIFFLVWGFFIVYAENEAYLEITKGKYLYSVWLLTIVCTMVVFARGQFDHLQDTLRMGEYLFLYHLLSRKLLI